VSFAAAKVRHELTKTRPIACPSSPVNCVAPGWIQTAGHERERLVARRVSRNSLQRWAARGRAGRQVLVVKGFSVHHRQVLYVNGGAP